jgi:hypothetical protein
MAVIKRYNIPDAMRENVKKIIRGISSVGRALRWQRRGHRFEPGMLHTYTQAKKTLIYQGFFFYFCLYST